MKICAIRNFNIGYGKPEKPEQKPVPVTNTENYVGAASVLADYNKAMLLSGISFTGKIDKIGEFEKRFPRSFFKKLSEENLPDPYTKEIKAPIPTRIWEELKKNKVFDKRGILVTEELNRYKNRLFPTEREVLSRLEEVGVKNRDLKLKQLLELLFPEAEQNLIKEQTEILNKINMLIRKLPKEEFKEVRGIVQEAFNKIYNQNPIPENCFKRQEFIWKLGKSSISDNEIRESVKQIADTLPTSANSADAFIVKYSQPYSVKFDKRTKSQVQIPITSETVGIRLMEPSVSTVDHIHSQKAFREEREAWLKSHPNAAPEDELKSLRVTILTSKRMNELKTDTELDDFIKQTDEQIGGRYIQKHLDKLFKVYKKWAKEKNKSESAQQLANYIKVLHEELKLRSENVNTDFSGFEKVIESLKAKPKKKISKKGEVKHKNNDSKSRDNADGLTHHPRFYEKFIKKK